MNLFQQRSYGMDSRLPLECTTGEPHPYTIL